MVETYKVSFERVSFDGDTFFVPTYAKGRPAAVATLSKKKYEPLTHAFVSALFARLGAGSMLHAGTFFGDMLPTFSKCVPGFVFAFEPVLENYLLARLSARQNNLTNVLLFNAALSNVVSSRLIQTFGADGMHLGGASQISEFGDLCTSITIDTFEFWDLKLIQLDVEGHEVNALQGAEKTISKHRPVIMIEDNKNICDKFLRALGYNFIARIPGLSIWIAREHDALGVWAHDFLMTYTNKRGYV